MYFDREGERNTVINEPTRRLLFPILQMHMDALGPFPRKILRGSQFFSQYFDPDFAFRYKEINTSLHRVCSWGLLWRQTFSLLVGVWSCFLLSRPAFLL